MITSSPGYCPQFDAVFNEMTGRETMKFFSMLRGLQPATAARQTIVLAKALGFTKHLDKMVGCCFIIVKYCHLLD